MLAFELLVETRFEEARQRGFDFGQDYRLLNQLGQTMFEQAKLERGDARRTARERLLREAESWFAKALKYDPENLTAHYNLALIYRALGDAQRAQLHQSLHTRYKPDDNAGDRAIAAHRRANPAADHAADPVVVYDLQRHDAYLLSVTSSP